MKILVSACLLGVSCRYDGTGEMREEVKELGIEAGRARGVILKRNGRFVEGDAVLVATGGLSYPATGSTGDGYRFAGQAGHHIAELSPALVPFETAEPVVKELQGLSLRNIRAAIRKSGKVLYEEFGEMLFTHFGVSGPIVLSASSIINRLDLNKIKLVSNQLHYNLCKYCS